jgi:hypothetical protein
MRPASSTQAIVSPKRPAPHTEAYRKREGEKERLREELMRARPSKGLSTLIADRWKEALFKEVLRELIPEKFIPTEIRALLKDVTETDKKVSAFVRVLFAQGERAWWSRAQAASPQTFGLGEAGMRAMLEESKRLPIGRRTSRRGKIDPSYDWWRTTSHEVPELGAALGLTPEGLKKKCTRLGIKLSPNPIRLRAATITPLDAIKLLELQAKRPINMEPDVRDRLLKSLARHRRMTESANMPIDIFAADVLKRLWSSG